MIDPSSVSPVIIIRHAGIDLDTGPVNTVPVIELLGGQALLGRHYRKRNAIELRAAKLEVGGTFKGISRLAIISLVWGHDSFILTQP